MRMKKIAAIVLAAVMAMGSTLTVFAAPESPVTSGSTEGEGKNEGHVEKEAIKVVLPTMPATGSPFDYITDPERLIQGTEGAAHAGAKFPDSGSDTGVYFKVGENEYANTSKTLQVINMSSCNVAVTVAIEAEQKSANDLVLAQSATTSKDNPLYLAVNVGSTTHALTSTSTPVKKVIAGNADNFEITYTSDGGYAYTTKKDAVNWKALQFNVTGSVDEQAVVTADTTAPTVKVTWSYAKAETADGNVSEADQVDYIDSPIVSLSPYTGVLKITNLKAGQTVTSASMTYTGGSAAVELLTNKHTTWNSDKTEATMNSTLIGLIKGGTVTITVTFSDGASTSISVLYVDEPIVTLDTTGVLKITNLKAGQTVTSASMTYTGGSAAVELLTNKHTTWNADKTEATMNSTLTDLIKGATVTIVLTFSDGTSKTVTAQY